MNINITAVFVCAILAMIVGAVWYGPIFGKRWLWVTGAGKLDLEKRKQMQASSWKLYFVQFILTFFQVLVLAYLLRDSEGLSSVVIVLIIWGAFVLPIVAGNAMWNNDSKKISWNRFFLQAGYQLIVFIIFGLILSFWN